MEPEGEGARLAASRWRMVALGLPGTPSSEYSERALVWEATGCGGGERRSVPIHLAGERRNREGRGGGRGKR
jgi:hypothetical protein